MLTTSEIKKLTDNELVEKYKSTVNYNYLGELYQRHTRFVFAVSMKYLKDEDKCNDAVMEIFEKLIKDLLKFDIDNFKPWLHTVTKNHCLLTIRSEGYKQKFENKYKNESEHFVENHEEVYPIDENEEKINSQVLSEAVDQLNSEQKECIELFYLQEKCYNDVSEITGFTMKQVKSYIQNGKRNLKNYLSKFENKSFTLKILILFMIMLNL